MSKNTSRLFRGRDSGGSGTLTRSLHQERQANKTATGAMSAVRTWQDPEPVAPLSAAELLREMKRLADKRGFRLRINGE
jgi:hypothetical protein